MLKSEEVNDVCRVAIVHENSLGIESFCGEHYDQRVIIRLLHFPSIFFREKHVLVCSSLLKWGYSVDAVHPPLTCFPERSERPTYGRPTCDCFYLPNHIWRMLECVILVLGRGFTMDFVIISRPTRFPLLQKLLQFPFSYKFLYLLLLGPCNPLCSGHDSCEIGNTYFCHARWATNIMALAI